jgi:hypothetical protein
VLGSTGPPGRFARLLIPTDQFYGMREFAIEDPDGYIIMVAQRTG